MDKNIGQDIKCRKCGWEWNTNDSEEFDKYVCHNCNFDNRTFYDSDPIGYNNGAELHSNKMSKGGIVSNTELAKDIIANEIPKIKCLECDGATRVLHYILSKNGVKHKVMVGTVEISKNKNIPYHYWIALPDGNIIDFKSRMWMGDDVEEGIFTPKQGEYKGKEIKLNMNETIYRILTMANGGETKYENGGLLAPNGEKSNLTPEQYKLVRTPEFKAWFGDWENDPENSSKVVDKNGEPMVVYHYSPNEFTIFDKTKHPQFVDVVENKKHKPLGYDFSTREGFYESKTRNKKYSVFLNAKNVFDFKEATENEYQKIIKLLSKIPYYSTHSFQLDLDIKYLKSGDWGLLERPTLEKYFSKNFDGLFMLENDWLNIKVYNSNQIKLSDGSNTTFDANNPDIRYEEGGQFKTPQTIEEIANNYDIDEIHKKVSQGLINSDDGAIYLFDNGIEVTTEIYDRLRNAEESFLKKGRGLQVGDIIMVKGKFGTDDFKGNFRGYTNEGKLVVVYDGGKQMMISKDEYYALGGEMSLHLAPNLKPSNLTPEQYKLVRTPEFKSWFGDWENDPENASQVVDNNGEPKVVFHGTPKDRFNVFNIVEGKNVKSKMQLLFGSHFASSRKDAEIYTKNKGNIYEVFLNIRKILNLNEHYEKTNTKFQSIIDVIKELKIDKTFKNAIDFTIFTEKGEYGGKSNIIQRVFLTQLMLDNYAPKKVFEVLKNKFDGISYLPYTPLGIKSVSYYSESYIAFKPEQIKLADGSNTTFDANNPDIRYDEGGLLAPNGKKSNLSPENHKLVRSLGFKRWYGDWENDTTFPKNELDENGEPIITIHKKNNKYEEGGLLAPNGKPSNLTPEQYKLVRTPEFKAWFGDWEKHPKKASKVVDKNGEPLVVYRGNEKNQEELGYEFKLGNNFLQKSVSNNFGFFFTNEIDIAKKYMDVDVWDVINGGSLTSVFLKSNRILDLRDFDIKIGQKSFIEGLLEKGINFDGYEYLIDKILNYFDNNTYVGWGAWVFDYFDIFPELRDLFLKNGFSSVLFLENSRNHSNYNVYVVFEPNQIKLADGSNITFDANNPDIRYEEGGNIESDAFKKWFGNSKVVDKKGNPLVVYHGSPDLRGLKSNYIFKSRFEDNKSYFFTDNYKMAKSYADPKRAWDYQNAEEGVIGLYLSIQNPLIVNAENQIWIKFETEINGEKIVGTKSLIEYAKNQHDGVIVKNVRDYYDNNDKMSSGGNVYVVFEPTQIKLADGTNTTFDSNNPDIRYEQGGIIDEEAQMYIDVISMNPNLEKYAKYKEVLKTKFGIDYDEQYGNHDEKLIDNANLNDLKIKDDFLNYKNYVKYAYKIFRLREFTKNQPSHIEGIVTLDLATKIGDKLGFKVEYKEYDGYGNYAAARGNLIIIPMEVNINVFIHEIGHYFDHHYCKEYIGNAKNSIYATSLYEVGKSDEVFAENFMTYFIAPDWLKNNMPIVYYELDEKIPQKFKEVINNLIIEVNKNNNAEMQSKSYHLGGEMSLHLAPNGNPSNLTHEQWHLVRTPEFKAWFGDWERLASLKLKDSGVDEETINNIAKDISKVVDENGEPKVMYHGTFRKFNIFKVANDNGFYFTSLKKIAEHYAAFVKEGNINFDFNKEGKIKLTRNDVEVVLSCFLNIKNLLVEDVGGAKVGRNVEKINKAKKNKYDGLLLIGGQDVGGVYDQFIVFNSNQIKLADGTNTTFDGNNPDIRYEEGGSIPKELYHYTSEINFDRIFDSNILNPSKRYGNRLSFTSDSEYHKKVHGLDYGNTKVRITFDNEKLISDGYLFSPFDHNTKQNKIGKEFEYIISTPIKNVKKYIKSLTFFKGNAIVGEIDKIDTDNANKYYLNSDISFKEGGLLAPNLKPSNLTPEQYQLVRTPEFKAWFGDWEYLANFNSHYLEISDTKDYVNGILKDDNFPKKIEPNSILHYKKGFEYILSSDENGKIIGALTIYPNGKIDQLAISDKMRGVGIGKKMIDLAIENGAKSVATYTKYSKSLIKYFLDKTVSKVVDDNGEPLVCYHGSKNKFSVFDINKAGTNTDKGVNGQGFYFSNQKETAYIYASKNENDNKGYLYECFVRIKNPVNPFIISTRISEKPTFELGSNWATEWAINNGFDGVIKKNQGSNHIEITAYKPNQIKLADGSNTTFDGNNPDIRYEEGGEIPKEMDALFKEWQKINIRVNEANLKLNDIANEKERPMGLVSDDIKKSKEFIEAKNQFNDAFHTLQKFNSSEKGKSIEKFLQKFDRMERMKIRKMYYYNGGNIII